jgi:hypothetical protein
MKVYQERKMDRKRIGIGKDRKRGMWEEVRGEYEVN